MSQQAEFFDALTCDPMDLIEKAGAELPEISRWPQRLADLYDIEFAYAQRQGMDDTAAAADAAARTLLIADYLGGGPVYLPRGDTLRTAVRDSQLYRRHRGNNTIELAQEYRVSVKQVYEIVAREKRRRLGRMQGRLFEAG